MEESLEPLGRQELEGRRPEQWVESQGPDRQESKGRRQGQWVEPWEP